MASTFREILLFFDKIGIYDVVLPFLLVFTIVFAIFEKTKVFGMDEIEGKKYSKKNLNAMAAFVIAFMVIASGKLVEIITAVSSQMVILLLLSVFFLVLIGSFFKEKEDVFLEGGWKIFFMIIMFIGIVIIFLQAIKTESGEGYFTYILDYVVDNFDSTAVGSIIFIILIFVFMWYITKTPGPSKKPEKKEEG